MPTKLTSDLAPGPYAGWTRERLIERLLQLEGTPSAVDEASSSSSSKPPPNPTTSTPTPTPTPTPSTSAISPPPPSSAPETKQKIFDFHKHPRRKIALKFCYSGWEYGGLAFQPGPTPLPTVENVLFDAMAKTRLVDPEAGPEACEWEKCGRTDRGVSSAGQVVSLWIRSALPAEGPSQSPLEAVNKEKPTSTENSGDELPPDLEQDFDRLAFSIEPSSSNTSLQKRGANAVKEHDYLAMINRLLPDTIRVIAWSPVPTSFSARFSCTYRHYKYFFSSLDLDIPAMQAAAARFVGEHDFRNFCKLDAQKQITSFRRTILRASVEPLVGEGEGLGLGEGGKSKHGQMYVFDLVGTAFLYHQVRHIMAVLFLVGSGLEHPSIVTQLFNVRDGAEPMRPEDEGLFADDDDLTYPVVDRKPEYMIADALPLVLWECGYDDSALLDWRTTNATTAPQASAAAVVVRGGGLYRQMQAIYNRSRVFSTLDLHFAEAVGAHHPLPSNLFPLPTKLSDEALARKLKGLPESERYMNIPLGGGTFKRSLKYTSVLKRKRLESVESTNERWRLAQIAKDASKSTGMTRVVEDDGNE